MIRELWNIYWSPMHLSFHQKIKLMLVMYMCILPLLPPPPVQVMPKIETIDYNISDETIEEIAKLVSASKQFKDLGL